MRFLGLCFELDDAEAVVGPELDGEGCQLLVIYAGAELAVERVSRGLLQRVAIDGVYDLLQFGRCGEKELVACLLIVLFEPFVGA